MNSGKLLAAEKVGRQVSPNLHKSTCLSNDQLLFNVSSSYPLSFYLPLTKNAQLALLSLLSGRVSLLTGNKKLFYTWFIQLVRSRLYTAISRKEVGKSARDNAERHCGWFWIHCSSEKFERIGTKGNENVFASANGKQQKQVRQLQSPGTVYLSYPILPFGIVACTFFLTTFLEIALYEVTNGSSWEQVTDVNPFLTSNAFNAGSVRDVWKQEFLKLNFSVP